MTAPDQQHLAEQLRQRIAAGGWPPGQRIPTERDLARSFGIARNTLRRALGTLEDEGLIVRHVGRGTFVAGRVARSSDSISASLAEAAPSDLIEVRSVFEPRAAAMAAARASAQDLARIEAALGMSLAAQSIEEFEKADTELHQSIFDSTKNELLATLGRALNQARNSERWYALKKRSITPQRRAVYDRQHSAMVAALRQRDAEAAARAMREHIDIVRENLFGAG